MVLLEETLAEKNNELLKFNQKLEELARIDSLMKIANRHSFHETVERMHDQFMRYGQGYGLLMCDVDFFKHYNDTFGHQAGDHALREVAGAIKIAIRQSDEAFRYGGEEIVVLLPAQDIEGAVTAGQRLCQQVSDLNLPHPKGVGGKVSISVGATACSGSNSAPSWKDLLEQADQALYQAKKTGRNRLVSFQPQPAGAASN